MFGVAQCVQGNQSRVVEDEADEVCRGLSTWTTFCRQWGHGLSCVSGRSPWSEWKLGRSSEDGSQECLAGGR